MSLPHAFRIAAAALAGLIVVAALAHRKGDAPHDDLRPAAAPGGRLATDLRACQAMGEAALRAARCRAAWAERRRRFFGVDYPGAYAGLGEAVSGHDRPLDGER